MFSTSGRASRGDPYSSMDRYATRVVYTKRTEMAVKELKYVETELLCFALAFLPLINFI